VPIWVAGGKLNTARLEDNSLVALENDLDVTNEAGAAQKCMEFVS
jgi:hypothetical protein